MWRPSNTQNFKHTQLHTLFTCICTPSFLFPSSVACSGSVSFTLCLFDINRHSSAQESVKLKSASDIEQRNTLKDSLDSVSCFVLKNQYWESSRSRDVITNEPRGTHPQLRYHDSFMCLMTHLCVAGLIHVSRGLFIRTTAHPCVINVPSRPVLVSINCSNYDVNLTTVFCRYGVATIGRLLKIIGLFCNSAL